MHIQIAASYKYIANHGLFNLHTAAPQPIFHRNSVSASFGSNVSLPCIVHSANPSPSYNWEKLSVEDASSEINGRILSDGSLLLQNVQKSGLYQCIAHNIYGSSTQLTELSKFKYLHPDFCLVPPFRS